MGAKYDRKETITGIIAVAGMLSIPVLVVKNRMKSIMEEEMEKRTMKAIIKNTMELESDLTNMKVIKYLQFIQSIEVPSKTLCKNVIIEGYKLIKDSDNISDKLKADLRILLECKGVSFVY
ncbi:transcription factor [Clostridium sp. JNZ J1-5]